MHVVSGLIELGEYDDVRAYVQQIAADQTELSSITSHVDDPAVAALLIAKASQATERGVDLIIEASTGCRVSTSGSPPTSTPFSATSSTTRSMRRQAPADPYVAVEVVEREDVVTVTVRDSGPGVRSGIGERVFSRGFSTKATGPGDERGIGLALVRLVCRKRGGEVTVRNDGARSSSRRSR